MEVFLLLLPLLEIGLSTEVSFSSSPLITYREGVASTDIYIYRNIYIEITSIYFLIGLWAISVGCHPSTNARGNWFETLQHFSLSHNSYDTVQ